MVGVRRRRTGGRGRHGGLESEWEGSGGIVNLETSGLKQIGRDERRDGGRVAHWRSTYYLTDTLAPIS